MNAQQPLLAGCGKSQVVDVSAADAAAVQAVLAPLDSASASTIFEAAPSIFMWWIRLAGDIGLASVPAAGHETLHALNKHWRDCNKNRSLFLLDEQGYEIGVQRETTPNYFIVLAEWPAARLTGVTNDRLSKYIVAARNHKDNDWFALLDETAAYAAGASIEVAMLSRYTATDLMQGMPQGSQLDGQLGGAVDFIAYLAYYLVALKKHDQKTYSAVVSDPGSRQFVCDLLTKFRSSLETYERLPRSQQSLLRMDAATLNDIESGPAAQALQALSCFVPLHQPRS